MKEKNLYTLFGIVFLSLYLISTVIFIFGLQEEVKVQNAQQLKLLHWR